MAVTIFGVAAVTFMMLMYALEPRGRRYILAFALGCALSSAYGFLSGAWPFGVVEAVWAVIAVRRFLSRSATGSRPHSPARSTQMIWRSAVSHTRSVAAHWARGDVYTLVVTALEKAGKSLDSLTVDDLAPVDHFHARGFPASVDLGDRMPIRPGNHILDIGCGIGGPARYFAQRFNCSVTGIDLTAPFTDAATKLTTLLGLADKVSVQQGDGQQLPFDDAEFDGAYTQHVTMNVPDRARFFAEAWRVLKPGAFFALTEHGLGPTGNPYHPVPWSEDGTGEWLVGPAQTHDLLTAAGFADIQIEDTGPKYLAAYRHAIALAEQNALPPLGIHLLLGENALQKTRNTATNIDEGRTHPIQVLCSKPS